MPRVPTLVEPDTSTQATPTRGQRVAVLRTGYVRLVDWMGDDLSVVNAARASYMKESADFSPADERLVAYLARHGHHSPFRHAVVSVEIKAPLMIARQWFKYRVGAAHSPDSAEMLGVELSAELADVLAWRGQGDDGGDGSGDLLHARNEASRRYVTLPPEFYVPDASTGFPWRRKPASSKQGSAGPVTAEVGSEATARLIDLIAESNRHYEWAIEAGISAEQARLFLPAYALHTVWRWTASIQALAHFLVQRLGEDAQGEIQAYARALSALVSPLFPHTLGTLTTRR